MAIQRGPKITNLVFIDNGSYIRRKKEVPTGLNQDSNLADYDNSVEQLRNTSITNCVTTLPKQEFHGSLFSLICLNCPLLKASTLRYKYGLSGSYDIEAWKNYNLRLNKFQQRVRPRIIILIQIHPKKVYSREIKYPLGPVRIRTHAVYDNSA